MIPAKAGYLSIATVAPSIGKAKSAIPTRASKTLPPKSTQSHFPVS
jgi:hypothetical protein